MQILVTGHRGFIGSHMSKVIPSIGYDLVEGNDLRDRFKLDTFFRDNGIDTVIHLAARAGVLRGEEFPEEYLSSNIQALINLLEMSKKYGVKHFVYFSSASVYGDQKPPNHEGMEASPKSLYGITKLAGELLVKNSGVPYTIIRPFNVYGENGRKEQVLYKWARDIKEGKPIKVNGNSKRGYTYVGDLIEGIKSVISKPATNDTYNFGGHEVISLEDIISLLPPHEENRLPQPKEEIEESYADLAKASKVFGYNPQTKFKEKALEIIKSL